MSRLRTSLSTSTFAWSPVMIFLAVCLLQMLLIGAFYYLASEDQLRIEPAELVLLLVYSGLCIFVSVFIAIKRHRWIQRENRVRERLLDVIDAIPDPSDVRDLKGKYIMWNKAAEVYHGIKSEHVLGKTPYELFPQEVAHQILALDAESFETNQPVLRRVVLPPLYGKGQRAAHIRVAPVRSTGASGVRGVVTILHDVTESEREAAAMRHLSSQLKMALDTSGFLSWIWDLENEQITYSAQYQTLLRYKGNNFNQDFNFHERVHPEDAAVVVTLAKRSMREEDVSFDQTYRLRCFDEVYRYFHASGEPSSDDKGQRYFAGLLCPLDRNAD